MAKKAKKKTKPKAPIKIHWRLFVKYYLFGWFPEDEETRKTLPPFRRGNLGRSYALAVGKYNNSYNSSTDTTFCDYGRKLTRKAEVQKMMDEELEAAGFNDKVIDSQLLDNALHYDPTKSTPAIKEYNRLKKRVDDKQVVQFNFLGTLLQEVEKNRTNNAGDKKAS